VPDPACPTDPGRSFFDDADLGRFNQLFYDDAYCVRHVLRCLYPMGFHCLNCNGAYYRVLNQKVIRCVRCHHKTWFLAGTIFHRTKLRLAVWFRAAYLLRNPDTNASRLARLLSVTYRTAWLLCHKLRFAMGVVHARKSADGAAPLRLAGERLGESTRHGCERLERPDLADRRFTATDDRYPWKRWKRERGPLPEEWTLANEVRARFLAPYHGAIGERYLQLYLDEAAFRFERRLLGLWRFVIDLATALPFTPPRTRRQLGGLPVPRPVRPWLALRELRAERRAT
jgi:hypothetical protein